VIEPFINPQEIPPQRFAALHSYGMTLAIGLSYGARLLFCSVILPYRFADEADHLLAMGHATIVVGHIYGDCNVPAIG